MGKIWYVDGLPDMETPLISDKEAIKKCIHTVTSLNISSHNGHNGSPETEHHILCATFIVSISEVKKKVTKLRFKVKNTQKLYEPLTFYLMIILKHGENFHESQDI